MRQNGLCAIGISSAQVNGTNSTSFHTHYVLNEVDFRDITGMGPNHFYEKKTMSDRVILIAFLAGPIHKLFKSVHFAVRWILRLLGLFILPRHCTYF